MRSVSDQREDDEKVHAFMASLGGEIGGNVCGTRWTCVCGDHGEAPSDTEAGLALYFHRRAKHT